MHVQYWQLQDAKARFSEVVRQAQKEGPQYISVHGKPAVVVLSEQQYQSLTVRAQSLVDFFRKSPLVGLKLNLKRDKSLSREIDL